ncbi:adventurous-gliding motility protein Z [Topomyia yanbarensis]|uniref:adventurous-gliding motility protein Z n=1 Tax=Topomyia yanbarensis TaxID=2498891 RepID=UPI00273B7560|nr:adventurous-gliding motility protein Z [Topomyia yanbarensis]XP_058838787.1 adventurous-gliding motility protein Z [Topomyia yanbarensis]XP_058838788.1 adventurous-gliding motility protein Z [Topomyia yanbarensis]XP_058838789.1 adventurous-gliding motility protein Z [Topomyia yanbarensis]XP_058838790.1 adventurous-gliding motility protein Z [Topomyia yanbarensis]XP_058838791.1 adventurous-gliding motility protein Z [Topomyia yanbarensis]
MESVGHVTVPLRVGGKKMRKRRELDALVAHSLAKSSGKRHMAGNGIASHDQLLSNSTDEQEDYSWQPKVRAQSRCRRKRFSCVRTCGPLILVSCIFLSLGFMYWLYFDIRQQVSEYRIRIEQVSATSHNVPEALQKWHETSKILEQNQTALNGRLHEIQQVLGNFSTELKQLRDTIEKKNENSQEAQLNSLMTNVANLGSQIKDALARISSLEDRYTAAQTEQKTLEKSVDDLQTVFSQIRNSSSRTAMAGDNASNVTEQNIANIREQLSTQITNLAQNFTAELETLKKKNVWLDNDLKSHEKSIDELLENSANVSSHVKSVENIWVEMKKNLTNLEGAGKQMTDQIELLQNVTVTLRSSIGTVREECDRYHSQNDVINGELSAIKDRLEKVVKQEIPATAPMKNVTQTQQKTIPSNLSLLFNNSPTESTASKDTTAAADRGPNQPAVSANLQQDKEKGAASVSAASTAQQTSATPSVSSSTSIPVTTNASRSKILTANGM